MFKQILFFTFLLLNCITIPYQFKTFWEWHKACKRLPFKTSNTQQQFKTILTADELGNEFDSFFTMMRSSTFTDDAHWVQKEVGPWFAWFSQKDRFLPYVQKLEFPTNAVVSFHGDLHGDIHAVNAYLQLLQTKGYLSKEDPFKIIDSKFYMVFLGDYTDRGWYGAEVIYTILRLKAENPNKVFMVRGNHEDKLLNAQYGFANEVQQKFRNKSKDILTAVYNMYNMLPVALYCGAGTQAQKNFLLCCHGGLEPGFNPQELLQHNKSVAYSYLGKLQRTDFVKRLPGNFQQEVTSILPQNILQNVLLTAPTTPVMLGFMWHDFIVNDQQFVQYNSGRGIAYGKKLTANVLKQHSGPTHKVRGIFRAHQHSSNLQAPMMQRILNTDNKGFSGDAGVGKLWINKFNKNQARTLWDGIVCTFLLAPGTYGTDVGFNYDAFGLLNVSEKFENWRLQVIRQIMF